MPGLDGLEVCEEIRKKYDTPIIVSSARHDITDKVNALELGADDYLPKPYNPKELQARIKSHLRRISNTKSAIAKSVKDLVYDQYKHIITMKGQELTLTNAEFDILSYLIKKEGGVVSREELVYNCSSISEDSSNKSIDVIISRIRQKMGDDPKTPKYIHSIRGIGYKLTQWINLRFYTITFIFIFAGVSVVLGFLWLIEYDQQNYTRELNTKYSLIANARLLNFAGVISEKEFEEQTKNYNKMDEITEAKQIRKILFRGDVLARVEVNNGLIEIISYNRQVYLNIIYDGKVYLYKDQDYQTYRYFIIKAIAVAVICILVLLYIYIFKKLKPLKRLKNKLINLPKESLVI